MNSNAKDKVEHAKEAWKEYRKQLKQDEERAAFMSNT